MASRFLCCICGGETTQASADEYLELSLRFPGIDDPAVQGFGAHASCLDRVVAPGFIVERWVEPSSDDPSELPARSQILAVPPYDAARGVVAPVEGGLVDVHSDASEVSLSADPAGLRDLARWCLALADPAAPDGAHVHLDPGIVPLSRLSTALTLARATTADFRRMTAPGDRLAVLKSISIGDGERIRVRVRLDSQPSLVDPLAPSSLLGSDGVEIVHLDRLVLVDGDEFVFETCAAPEALEIGAQLWLQTVVGAVADGATSRPGPEVGPRALSRQRQS